MAAAVERNACVLAAHLLRDAVLRDSRLPVKFDSSLQSTLRACVPPELSGDASACHSKVLGVASAVDGSYAAFYRVDAAMLGRGEFGYGRDLRFTVGAPGRWRVEGVGAHSEGTYDWVGDWDVRQRPWLTDHTASGGSRAIRDGAWSRPYADPVTREILESYVVPLLRGGDRGEVVGVVLAGTFLVHVAGTGI
jgi:hypothetical protein